MSRPRPEDLRGEALRTFETWRQLGMSEASAMAEVVRAGHVQLDSFDRTVETFRALGMSESAARVAAIGRNSSEAEARRALGAPAAESSPGNAGPGPANAVSELAALWREIDDFWKRQGGKAYRDYLARHAGVSEASGRSVPPAKATPPAKSTPRPQRPATWTGEVTESCQILRMW